MFFCYVFCANVCVGNRACFFNKKLELALCSYHSGNIFYLKFYDLYTKDSTYDESVLVQMLVQNNEHAFQLIYDKCHTKIYQAAKRLLKSPELAREVVQEVFLKLWLNRATLDSDQPIEAWLHVVAKNNILNKLKKIAVEWQAFQHLGATLLHPVNNASNKLEEAQYDNYLQEAIKSLSPQQQSVFLLARQQQLSYIEIGEQLNLSPLTVKTHMARALQAIRKWFSQKGIVLPALVLAVLFNFF